MRTSSPEAKTSSDAERDAGRLAALVRLDRLEQYLESDPGNPRLQAEVADLALQLGQPQRAEPVVRRALERQPSEAGWRYRSAAALRQLGEPAKAQDMLAELIGEGFGDPAIRLELARAAAAAGDWMQAAQTAETLIGVDAQRDGAAAEPTLPHGATEAAVLGVRAWHRLGYLERAAKLGEVALAHLGTQPDATSESAGLAAALATLYVDAERTVDAARLVALAESCGAMGPEMQSVAGFLALEAADPTTALKHFARSLGDAPVAEPAGPVAESALAGRAQLGRGLAHAMAGQAEAAIEALELATRNIPTHLGSWHALAWMHLMSRDAERAQHAFDQALAVDRNFGDTHGGLAIVAALRGHVDSAESSLRRAERLDRSSLNSAVARLLIELRPADGLHDAAFQQRAAALLEALPWATGSAHRTLFQRMLVQQGLGNTVPRNSR